MYISCGTLFCIKTFPRAFPFLWAELGEPALREARETAESYRNRATELRAIAETDWHGQTHDMLMKIAKEYDRMARNLEAVAESKELLNRP